MLELNKNLALKGTGYSKSNNYSKRHKPYISGGEGERGRRTWLDLAEAVPSHQLAACSPSVCATYLSSVGKIYGFGPKKEIITSQHAMLGPMQVIRRCEKASLGPLTF